jgi:hypothetical protein
MAALSDSLFSARRRQFQQTFDSGRYLLHIIILLCLMSLLTLGQTGVVATKGYAVSTLETDKKELIRLREQLEVRYATAQSLERIRRRAEQLGLRPTRQEQIRYMTIVDPTLAAKEEQDFSP